MLEDLVDGKLTLVYVMAWCPRKQSITWANAEPFLCHHTASLSHNELSSHDKRDGYSSYNKIIPLLQAYNDPRLRETADQLIQAQDEIDQLHAELRERDGQIHEEIGNTEQSQQTIGEWTRWGKEKNCQILLTYHIGKPRICKYISTL